LTGNTAILRRQLVKIVATTDNKYRGKDIDDSLWVIELEPNFILDITKKVSFPDGRIVLESENYVLEGR
jgi:hypothetical protein